MAQENIKDFTIEWAILGLLFFCLLTFSISFMLSNNPAGISSSDSYILNNASGISQSNLLELDNDANIVLNITAQTQPEDSFLGSRDSVSTSFIAGSEGRNSWDSMKQLIAWTFAGDVGKMLISVLGGLMGFLIFYFAYKFIRGGN